MFVFQVLVCIIDLIYPPRSYKLTVKNRKDSDSGQESVSYYLLNYI